MFQEVKESGEESTQFAEDRLILEVIFWKSASEQFEIPDRNNPEKMLEISYVSEALVLD